MLAAHFFIQRMLDLQPDHFFFHGATLAIGRCGVLLSGPKGAGKSTVSLALAARGHGLLSDEFAAIHAVAGDILPFRRAVSIREGPQANAVREYLERNPVAAETAPDGSKRIRVRPTRIFPGGPASPVRLTHAFFLDVIGQAPEFARFDFSDRDLARLKSLRSSSPEAPGLEALRAVRLLSSVRCYRFSPGGSPDESAELIENIVEGAWDTACRKEPSTSAPIAG